MAKYIFLLAFVLPVVLGTCNVNKARVPFKRSIYDFSLALSTRIAVDKELHFVASPLSVWSIISAVSRGATGKTLEEIQKVLKHHPNRCLNNRYYDIVSKLVGQNTDVTLERSGAIVIDNAMNVNSFFINKVERNAITKVLTLPFDEPEQTVGEINAFVSDATHGIIEDLVDSDDLTNKQLLLIDTIYFKGNWKVPFLLSETKLAPFYNDNKEPLGDVNLMFVNDKFYYVNMELIGAQVLELSYGNERFSMLIFLPFEGTTLMTVVDKLEQISLRSIYSLFEERSRDSVMVQMPRFKIESDLDYLEELLKDMGLESMFESSASFPGISDYPVFVSGLKQKASIEVTEEGTEAVAASEVGFENRSMPLELIIQKPFFFMIVEKPSEVVLFTGAYSKPSLF